MNNIQKKCLRVAKDLFDLPTGRSKHFSFLVLRNNIISVGWNNSLKTHPLANKFGHRFNGIHSELSVIKNNNDNFLLPHLSLINIRFLRNGKLGNSKPCIPCQTMLDHFGIKKVFYTYSGGFNVL